MKVEKTQPKFSPYEVTITIHTNEEEQALLRMCCYNESIPKLLTLTKDGKIVEKFLNKLTEAINS